MIDTDAQVSQVIFALASTTRRRLLERLADCDGQRLKELCVDLDISRQATMKHIEQLETCGLVTIRRSLRETRIFLNAEPIRLVQRSFFEQFV